MPRWGWVSALLPQAPDPCSLGAPGFLTPLLPAGWWSGPSPGDLDLSPLSFSPTHPPPTLEPRGPAPLCQPGLALCPSTSMSPCHS